MEPLDKLEMIFRGMQKQKKVKLGRGKRNDPYGSSELYRLGLEHEISTLSEVIDTLQAVRDNHHSVRDEMVLKMYGRN